MLGGRDIAKFPSHVQNATMNESRIHRNLFPSVDSVFKLFYLGLKNISRKWTQPVPNWRDALNRFAIEFADRMPTSH